MALSGLVGWEHDTQWRTVRPGSADRDALPRAGAVRGVGGASGSLRTRPRPVGRAAPGHRRAHRAGDRHGLDHRRGGRAAGLDPAAAVAGSRHGQQRRPRRQLDERDAGAAARRRPAGVAHSGNARRDRALRAGERHVHRRPLRPRTARRADDGPGPPDRALPAPGPRLHRADRAGDWLAARRNGWRRHGAVRRQHRPARAVLPAAVRHASARQGRRRTAEPGAGSG